MLKKSILEDIFEPATLVGIQNANDPVKYKNLHIPNGVNFLKNVPNVAINDLVVLIAILKSNGYWSQAPRYIGSYQHQPDPYVGKPHISLSRANCDVARICFVTDSAYFGVSFFKAALVNNCKYEIVDSSRYPKVALRWAPKDIKHFLENPNEYITPYHLI